MDHSMPSHDMPSHEPMCSMNMLFTWDTTNLCIIFRGWHIKSTFSLILSLLGIVALTAGYELVREISRRYETQGTFAAMGSARDGLGGRGDDGPFTDSPDASQDARSPLLWPGTANKHAGSRRSKTVKGLLYAIQVFYSFFIMLLFMTYNGWVMLAVAVGAFVGYMVFGSSISATKSVACH